MADSYKRLCIFSDGTWNSPENPTVSNIVKLSTSVRREDDNGVQQVVFYDEGVGTSGDQLDKLLGGGFGEGIDRNVIQLYTFLAMNYKAGDEVYMFGFSRGAYTVRSVAGMMHHAGLARRTELEHIREAYELYRTEPDPESEAAIKFRAEHGDRIDIKLVACFDTVGSLGLPFETNGFFGRIDRQRYQFYDTMLSGKVENGIHVLSLDEDRKTFQPTRMDYNPKVGPGQVTELFFWGGHGGVGGSDSREIPCGQITLRFMVDEMKRRGMALALDESRIPHFPDAASRSTPITRAWFWGAIDAITGKYIRHVKTVEEVHPIAQSRYGIVNTWRPASLRPWEQALLTLLRERGEITESEEKADEAADE